MVISTTLTACANPIVGEWKATQLDDGEGTVTELPYQSCYTPYEGYDETTGEYIYGAEECNEISYKMTIDSELKGVFTMSEGDNNLDLDLTATKDAASEWTLETDQFSLDCALTENILECRVQGSTIFFEK